MCTKGNLFSTPTITFGSKSSVAEHYLEVTHCPMCGTEVHLLIRQLPPTKGPNILSLDGGGIRGIKQLGLLQSLEKRLGRVRLTEVFDLCVGTSVGMFEVSICVAAAKPA